MPKPDLRVWAALIALVLAVFLAACELTPVPPPVTLTVGPTADPGTPTPTAIADPSPGPTATTTPTVTPEPSATPTITPTPTETPRPTPTQIVPDVEIPEDAPNLVGNPSFEGEGRHVIFGEIYVVWGWQPYYCDEPYTPEKCPALRLGDGNPIDLVMGRPEFKVTNIHNRVYEGTQAQQWFCFMRACRAGVHTTVDTVPGQVCEVTAYVQTWSANGTGLDSDVDTQDARDNSAWLIRVSLTGDTWAFADENLVSRAFGYEDGHYDHYARISYRFNAISDLTTVFIENLRLWPIANNDSYVGFVSVRCTDVSYVAPGDFLTLDAQSLGPAGVSTKIGEDTMQLPDFSFMQIVTVVVTLLAFVPLLGGGPGLVVSAIVNLVKVIGVWAKRPLPDNWGGYLSTILNALIFVGLLIWLGVSPVEVPLPAEIDALFTSAAEIISLLAKVATGAMFLIGQFGGAELAHRVARRPLLELVSTSYREGQESVRQLQAARGLAGQPVG